MAYAGLPPASFANNLTNVQLIDDISTSFNGSTQTFALTSNSTPFHSVSARSLIVVLGGIVQKPNVDYTVDGGNITFTVAPVSGLTFAARNIYGLNYIDSVNDGAITPTKLSLGAPSWTTSGNVTVSGDLNVTGSFNSGTQGLFWGDNEVANFGDGNDLKIYHDGFDSYINDTGDGNIHINTNGSTVRIISDGSTTNGKMADFTKDGAVSLYYDNLLKIQTATDGVSVTGRTNITKQILTTDSISNTNSHISIVSNGGGSNTHQSVIHFGPINASTNTSPAAIVAIAGGNTLSDLAFYVNTNNNYSQTPNTEALRITGDGNVGIGFADPSSKLQINGNIRVRTATASMTDQSLEFSESGSGSSYGVRIGHTANTSLAFERYDQGWSEMMRIVGNGTVGIGTTNPSKRLHLYVSSVGDGIHIANATNSYPAQSTGYSDIRGTFYDYLGGGSTAGGESIVRFGSENAYATDRSSYISFLTSPANGTGSSTEKLRITSAGNVGIGTTNPLDKLHVEGDLRLGTDPLVKWTSNYIKFQNTTASVPVIEIRESGSGNYEARMDFFDGDGVTKNIRINANPAEPTLFNAGNVGIGTTNPSIKLHISGISTGTQTELFRISGGERTSESFETGFRVLTESLYVNGNRHLRLICNSSNVFSFQPYETSTGNAAIDRKLALCPSGGKVGIGTNDAQKKLHITQSADNDGIRLDHANRATGTYWDHHLSGVNNEAISWVQYDGSSTAVPYVMGREYHVFYTYYNGINPKRLHIHSRGAVTRSTGSWNQDQAQTNSLSMGRTFEGYTDSSAQSTLHTCGEVWMQSNVRNLSDFTADLISFQGSSNCGIFVTVEGWMQGATSVTNHYQMYAANIWRVNSNNFNSNLYTNNNTKIGSIATGQSWYLQWSSSGSGAGQVMKLQLVSQASASYVRYVWKVTYVGHDYISYVTLHR